MLYAVPAAPVRSLAIADQTARFPVNRIFCIGRNYAAHAREMGGDPDREAPFFFMKPASAIVAVDSGEAVIAYPPMTADFHHEIELVVAIGEGGMQIAEAQALQHVYGYAVGLDMTRRDLQQQAKDKSRPWEFAKAFSQSAPVGVIHRAIETGALQSAAISLTVNGQVRQNSDIDQMIWSVAESIAYLSRFEPLEAGDLIMTGTPAGVAAVKQGDLMVGAISGLGELRVRVE